MAPGKRFVVRADEKLTAFVELETAVRGRSPPLGGSDDPVRLHLIFAEAVLVQL